MALEITKLYQFITNNDASSIDLSVQANRTKLNAIVGAAADGNSLTKFRPNAQSNSLINLLPLNSYLALSNTTNYTIGTGPIPTPRPSGTPQPTITPIPTPGVSPTPPVGSFSGPFGSISMAYGNGVVVAGVSNSGIAVSTNNGDSWVLAPADIQPGSVFNIGFANNKFFSVGGWASNTGVIYSSTDGIYWTGHALPSQLGFGLNFSYGGLVYGNGVYVLAGSDWNSPYAPNDYNATNKIFYSTNGTNWNQAILPTVIWPYNLIFDSSRGRFVLVGAKSVLMSTDGINWVITGTAGAVNNSFPSNRESALLFKGSTLYSFDYSGYYSISNDGGETWSDGGYPYYKSGTPVYDAKVINNSMITASWEPYVSDPNSYYVRRTTDGINWSNYQYNTARSRCIVAIPSANRAIIGGDNYPVIVNGLT